MRCTLPVALILALAVACLAGLVQPGAATSLIHFGTQDLLDLSDIVAVGNVVSVECYLHPEGQFPMTRIGIEVTLPLKGSPSQLITLEELGGQVDKLIGDVPGVPQFEQGEEVLVFLESMSNGKYRTYGMFQGKFTIVIDASGERYLRNQDPAAMLVDLDKVEHICPPLPNGLFPYVPFVEGIRIQTGQ